MAAAVRVAPVTVARPFSTTLPAYKTITETVKDTAATVNKKIGETLAGGIESGGKSLYAPISDRGYLVLILYQQNKQPRRPRRPSPRLLGRPRVRPTRWPARLKARLTRLPARPRARPTRYLASFESSRAE